MSIYNKNTALNILYFLLLATLGFERVNLAWAEKLIKNSQELETKAIIVPRTEAATSKFISFDRRSENGWHYKSSLSKKDSYFAEDRSQSMTLKPATKNNIEGDIFLAAASLNILSHSYMKTKNLFVLQTRSLRVSLGNFQNKVQSDKERESSKLIQQIALFFFLLLFIPFGVFYPFFLFYKKLFSLGKEDEFLEQDLKPFPISTLEKDDDGLELDREVVFNKLQIAFYPEAGNFKQQLELINLASSKGDRLVIELMQQTVSLLITQQYWTHVNSSCLFTSITEAQQKIEADLLSEQEKYITRKSVLNSKQNRREKIYRSTNSSKYTVVTILFSTDNGFSLSENINTKEELAEQLIELSVINSEDLINFELLWNPQQKGEFLSNEDLLTYYEDLTRLL